MRKNTPKKPSRRALALFIVPICCQLAAVLAFEHLGYEPIDACAWSTLAMPLVALVADAYALIGFRLGILPGEWRDPLHGLLLATVSVGMLGAVGTFALTMAGGGIDLMTVIFGYCLGLAYLTALMAILGVIIGGLMDILAPITIAALAVQAAAYCATITFI